MVQHALRDGRARSLTNEGNRPELAAARAALGDAAFERARTQGRAMTTEQAVELALAQPTG
jgi:hypothetical protein